MVTYRKAIRDEKIIYVWSCEESTPVQVGSASYTCMEATEFEYQCFKGDPPLVVEYLRCDKDSMRDTAEGLGLTKEQSDRLITALYEVRFLVDVTTGTIFAVNGKILDTAEDYEGIE